MPGRYISRSPWAKFLGSRRAVDYLRGFLRVVIAAAVEGEIDGRVRRLGATPGLARARLNRWREEPLVGHVSNFEPPRGSQPLSYTSPVRVRTKRRHLTI